MIYFKKNKRLWDWTKKGEEDRRKKEEKPPFVIGRRLEKEFILCPALYWGRKSSDIDETQNEGWEEWAAEEKENMSLQNSL